MTANTNFNATNISRMLEELRDSHYINILLLVLVN